MAADVSNHRETESELRRVCAELERRLGAGESCSAEAVLASHPSLAGNSDDALEVIYTEFVARERLGQTPNPTDYCTRFPQWRAELDQLFDVHRATGSDSAVSSGSGWPGGSVPAGTGATVDGAARRIGNYEVLEEVGRGGMGVVYKARQIGLNRVVALKMILTGDDAGPRERARFRSEAEAAARLHHPNIVQIHEVGEHEGRPFLSLEFVDGGTLEDTLTGAPWPPAKAADLIETTARAMHHAHGQGIVHRDLKPANILLKRVEVADSSSGNGQSGTWAKITDFGLARRLQEGDTSTQGHTGPTRTGAIVGTPAYMAPEQTMAGGSTTGPATDVYALGAILYELLTGRPPFLGVGVLETLEQVRNSDPLAPSRLMPGLPHDLETICLKCLRKEPGQRYATAAELGDDLRRFQRGEPVRARPAPTWEKAWKWARRRPAVSALMAALACSVIVTLAAVSVLWRQTVATLDRERAQKSEIEAALSSKLIALAERDWSANEIESALRHLEGCPPNHRGPEWRYLHRVCTACLFELRVPNPLENVITLAWSPDGRHVAACCAGGVMVWDPQTGKPRHHLKGHKYRVEKMAFRPDGLLVSVAFSTVESRVTKAEVPREFEIKIWDLEIGREVRGFAPVLPAVRCALGRDGSCMIAVAPETTTLVEIGEKLVATTIHPQPPSGSGLAISPNGRLFARISGPGRDLNVWDLVSNQPAGPFKHVPMPAQSLSFNPQGDRVVVGRFEREKKSGLIEFYDYRQGVITLSLRGHSAQVECLEFTPDGRYLASGSSDKTAIVWDLATGNRRLVLRGHKDGIWKLAFSPDGTRLASTGGDGTVRIWDVRLDE
jgi:serine/threonine protein kinase